jgi:hypothetical protein
MCSMCGRSDDGTSGRPFLLQPLGARRGLPREAHLCSVLGTGPEHTLKGIDGVLLVAAD